MADGVEVDEPEDPLSVAHRYNLRNQGWTDANINTWGVPSPTNADVMYMGKDATGEWSKETLRESFLGNSPAPKGRYILDFFNRGTDREAQSSVSLNTLDQETGMFSAAASNFGRALWARSESESLEADAKSPNASSMILYTQIIERDEQLGNCYTEADPSAEMISDQVDADGGFILIPELGKVIAMRALGNQVV
ncbi:MAG: hypothetical protein GY814_01915, partial [Gammaproteobacteria bacterium]|nr:hypothetical protein [Gammaproteobacteria bacterium]